MPFAPDQTTAERGLYQSHSQNGSGTTGTPTSDRHSMMDNIPKTSEQNNLEFKTDLLDRYNTYRDCRNEKSRHANGLPELAAEFEGYDNTQLVRRFSLVGQMLLLYSGSRLEVLHSRLKLIQKQRGDRSKRLTKNQLRPAGHLPMLDDEQDAHIEAMKEEFLHYHNVRAALKSSGELYPMYPQTYDDTIDRVIEKGMLEKNLGEDSPWAYLSCPDDMALLCPQDPPWVVEMSSRVINSRVYQWFKPPGPHSRRDDFVPRSILNFIRKVVYFLSTAFALLLPAGILYLVDLTPQQDFGVMSGSTIAFYIAASATVSKTESNRVLVVGIAYAAFLGTIAQLSKEVTLGQRG